MPALFLFWPAFGLICLGLMLIAFRPAWREWRQPTDCTPLTVGIDYSNDIIYFAEKFRTLVLAYRRGEPQASSPFQMVNADIDAMCWSKVTRPLLSLTSLVSQQRIHCAEPLFVDGNIELHSGDRLAALFAQGSLHMDAGSEVYIWAHAEKDVVLGRGCSVRRRLSSMTSIELGVESSFERVHAPIVYFGGKAAMLAPPDRVLQKDGFFKDIPNAVLRTPVLYRVNGDCVLPPNSIYRGSLIVTGCLFVGAGTTVIGDIKARMGIVIEAGAQILGSVVSERRIQILQSAKILGPLISESIIHLNEYSIIGSFDFPTTVTAKNIVAEAGAMIHGTVWARELGIVWSF
ncbi:polymer-forming cytoskeletal protein [Undibacterium sp. Ji67W]|uniref:polymer-forming cytoskeletal protein n=1 Tax=Undibacterium sp. Ji67W TaxID=3413042 RepID=UPI003BF1EB15